MSEPTTAIAEINLTKKNDKIEEKGQTTTDMSTANAGKAESPKPQTAKPFDSAVLRSTLAQMTSELGDAVLERKEIIKGAVLALLTGTHIFQYGPPGTAKSLLAILLGECVDGATYFEKLLHRNTKPADLFGAPNIKYLHEHGIEKLNTAGKLPTAQIAFLDEFFKCNPNLLNALLTVLNERKFDDGTGTKKIPLRVCFAASNEIPMGEAILEALYDRLLQRFTVPYLQDNGSFDNLLAGRLGEVTATVSMEELESAQKEINLVELGPSARQSVIAVKDYLEKDKGIIRSDRRWKQSMQLAKANAWLNGRTRVTEDDLMVLRNTLCNDMTGEEFAKIDAALKKLENPTRAKMKKMASEFDKAFSEFNSARNPQSQNVLAKMDDVGKEMKKFFEAWKNGRDFDPTMEQELESYILDRRAAFQTALKKEADRAS